MNISCTNQVSEGAKEKIKVDTNHVGKNDSTKEVNNVPVISSLICQNSINKTSDNNLNQLIFNIKQSILSQDTVLLLSTMDSSIVTSHGGGLVGFEDLLDNWKNRNLWAKLDEIISLGGNFSNDTIFRYPFFTIYQNCQKGHKWTEDDQNTDPYITYYTIVDTTNLFSEPSTTSPVKAKLVGAFLNRPYDTYNKSFDNGMVEVEALDKKYKGFVISENLYRTGDYNLIIEADSNNNWRITSFAPYD